MKLVDIVGSAWNSVRSRKLRFALNLIGIMIGCAAVMGLISLTQGLNEQVRGQLEIMGPTSVMLFPGQLDVTAAFGMDSFDWKNLRDFERLPHVEKISPIIGNDIVRYMTSRGEKVGYLYGVDDVYFQIYSRMKVADGRALRRTDDASAVIGWEIAHPPKIDKQQYRVGDRIHLTTKIRGITNEVTLKIVGIMEKVGGFAGQSSNDDNSIMVPSRTAQQFLETGGEIAYITLKIDEVENMPLFLAALKEEYGDKVSAMTQETTQELVGSVLGSIQGVLGGIAAISLFVAGVGIINTMTISVMERTQEIGVMKALGAKSREVLLMFLSEALLTGVVGGAVGVLLGSVAGEAVGQLINMPVHASLSLGGMVVLFAVIVCVLSGIYPAWRAAKLNPVEALRSL